MNRFPTQNTQAYYVSRAYEGNPILDSFKGAGQALADWGYQAQQTIGIIPKPPGPGEPGGPVLVDVNKNKPPPAAPGVTQGTFKRTPIPESSFEGGKFPSGGEGTKSPAGCVNCGSDWWNPLNLACNAQKVACEAAAAAGGGLGGLGWDFMKYLPYIAIAGGLILLIVLLKR